MRHIFGGDGDTIFAPAGGDLKHFPEMSVAITRRPACRNTGLAGRSRARESASAESPSQPRIFVLRAGRAGKERIHVDVVM